MLRGSSIVTPSDYFEKYIPLVHRIFHRDFTEYAEYMEDLVQEGYMALWNSCNGFDESLGIKFITYAYRSVKNNMLNYVERFIHKHQALSLEASLVEGTTVSLEDILFEEQDTFAQDLIQCCLEKVPQDDKQKINLIMQGYTQDEVAKIMNISQASVSRCLQRFKTELLKEMEE